MSNGRFGRHGGQFIPETLMNAIMELEDAYNKYKNDKNTKAFLEKMRDTYAGHSEMMEPYLGVLRWYIDKKLQQYT